MGGLFPEMLARDLEMSSAVFAAKNMTAGSPSTAIFYEEKQGKSRSMPRPGRILTSPYQSGPVRIQALGAIEERQSMVSFIEQRRDVSEETGSDVESLPATESSEGIEGPSIRLCEQAIVTAATSLTSEYGIAPSPKTLLSPERAQVHSWIDVDSDDEDYDEIEMRQEPAPQDQSVALSPRPVTTPASDETFDITVMMQDMSQSPRSRLHKPGSFSSDAQNWHSRQRSQKSIEAPSIPPRSASLSQASTTTPKTPCFDVRISTESQRQIHQSSFYTQRFRDDQDSSTILLKSDFGSIELELEEDDNFMDDYSLALSRPETIYIQQTPPPSPLPTVQSWLDGSNPPCMPQIPVDDLAKAVPLPPDIVETLRVSIACFPETMLLSSSLTIETIRSYSKKVRHPSIDVGDESLVDPAAHPRKSIWKKVVSHSRETKTTQGHRSHMHEDGGATYTMASPAPWATLRHVFTGCSDYICDAMYAHIVAYNYVSRVPRNQPVTSNRCSSSSSKRSQSDDIPKKAATLLGLGAPATHLTPNVGRFTKKLTTPLTVMGFGKEDMSSTTTTAQDNATRNIESGLLRCISRLVATAKMMAEEGSGEDSMLDIEPQEVDMIFVRSLCEIVRISEEM
ncbi:hypothetical protein FZEAL_1513 [Fusarium zealandicum]|uniref:Uncharacterized protein n=1 Tax=Fusarium zealandicum TaxID=1053134 RepID=A0A8H4XNM2_9HYPO|nr:hypothetical protein FZEAL_1513 [Fusarium zealandicum]